MNTWHANLAATYESAHASDGGLSPASAWGGMAGLQRAIMAASTGDIILAANAADPADNVSLTTLGRIECSDTSGLAVGDLVTNQTRTGTARIAGILTNSALLVEWGSGSFVTGDEISPDGGATIRTIGATSSPGLLITAETAAAGPITLAGVAADFETDQSAVLDSGSAVPGLVVGGVDCWTIRNVRSENASLYGLEAKAAGIGWRFEGVEVFNAAAHGWRNMSYLTKATLVEFSADQCGSDGMNPPPRWSVLEAGAIVGNSSEGMRYVQSDTLIRDCLIAGNGSTGVAISADNVHLRGCVIADNVGAGVAIETSGKTNITVETCRVTGNGGHGFESVDGHATHRSDRNVYFNNAAGAVSQIASGASDHGPAGSGLAHEDVTGDGYVDAAGGDYSLEVDAIAASEAAALTSATTVYVTAGLTGAAGGGSGGGHGVIGSPIIRPVGRTA